MPNVNLLCDSIKGPGIFITTPRGLESRAVREAYDILNDVSHLRRTVCCAQEILTSILPDL